MNKIFFFLLTLLTLSPIFGQENLQSIEKPSSDDEVYVYISRVNTGAFLINFRVFDGDKFLGTISSGEYYIYKTTPGKHIFWAASENRDFLDANLQGGKTYFIQVDALMGAFVAQVDIRPLDPNYKKDKKQVWRIIKNGTKIDSLSDYNKDKTENISKGMEKYNELKKKDSNKIESLPFTYFFDNANKP